MIDDFLAESGWDGGMRDLAHWWVAPPEWRGLAALGGVQYARFALALTSAGDGQGARDPSAALARVDRQHAMLRWERESAGSADRFAKFVGKQRDLKGQLATSGFLRDRHSGGFFSLPLVIDAPALDRAAQIGDYQQAVEPIAAALRTAQVLPPSLKPLVDWTREQLDRCV